MERDLVMDSLVHKPRNVSLSAQDLCQVGAKEREREGEEEWKICQTELLVPSSSLAGRKLGAALKEEKLAGES